MQARLLSFRTELVAKRKHRARFVVSDCMPPACIQRSHRQFPHVSEIALPQDRVLLHFLRARRFDVDRAVLLYENHQNFRRERGLGAAIAYDEVHNVPSIRAVACGSYALAPRGCLLSVTALPALPAFFLLTRRVMLFYTAWAVR